MFNSAAEFFSGSNRVFGAGKVTSSSKMNQIHDDANGLNPFRYSIFCGLRRKQEMDGCDPLWAEISNEQSNPRVDHDVIFSHG